MRKVICAMAALALLGVGTARAEGNEPAATEEGATPAPSTPAPNEAPPQPPANPPPPPSGQAAPQAQAPAPAPQIAPPPAPEAQPGGQWSYTAQYGWVWMPYVQSYTYVTPGADLAWMYVYRPTFGWAWVEAPWVLGFGPRPYWGYWGPRRFYWYAHPWWHAGPRGVWRGHPYAAPVHRAHPVGPHHRR